MQFTASFGDGCRFSSRWNGGCVEVDALAQMLDVRSGRVAYAVLSQGGFLGVGTTLHAIPWSALTLDTDKECFRVDITAQH